MICTNCGHKLGPSDLFCGECGTKVQSNETTDAGQVSVEKQSVQGETIEKQVFTTPGHEPSKLLVDKEQLNAQSRELVDEGKGFFRQAFKNHDTVFSGTHKFSFILSAVLILAGLILTAILLGMKIPESISYMGVTKSSVLFKLCFYLLILLAVIIGSTFLLTKFTINHALTFQKVLSDYVLVNVFSFIIFLVGILLLAIDLFNFGSGLIFLGGLLFMFSPLYMIGKYSSHTKPSMPSFYAAIIYIALICIILNVFKDSLITSLAGSFSSIFQNVLEGIGNGYFNNY
ncbi:zinc ribbon domain-containing protein [Macrococcus hajekii]|uniref:Zinc ribbon domain-containing protein n=1 Tax=Macrococcus hajekii TaxID=198482 RepID=A0A4R6BL92_9STAP|nr:zinc ribbon domain-containing protein [Macrococcus hajekii]TDM02539.1 zinc ribbon domain-containing protein [Macrococcus hajekii]GGB01783.1 hypothetical protein GCM10007190_07210 [Macrococcus hajekii]